MVYTTFTLWIEGFHAQLLQISSGGGPRCLTAQKVTLFVQDDGGGKSQSPRLGDRFE